MSPDPNENEIVYHNADVVRGCFNGFLITLFVIVCIAVIVALA